MIFSSFFFYQKNMTLVNVAGPSNSNVTVTLAAAAHATTYITVHAVVYGMAVQSILAYKTKRTPNTTHREP